MITESGSIKVTTEINEKMLKESSRGTYNMGLAFTIIGAIGVAVFLVLVVLEILLEWTGGYIPYIIVSALIMSFGISVLMALNKALTTDLSTRKIYVHEFFKDYLITNQYSNGENVATAKFYNSQITKGKETANYLFFYINSVAAFPVDKSQLNEVELNALRRIFKLPVRGGTVVIPSEPLPPQNSELSEVTPPEPPAATDPFDEFKS